MSSDVDRLRICVRELNQTWTIPLRFAVALYLVVEILGAVPASAGLTIMILLVPVTRKFLRYSKAFQKTIMKHTDERVRQTQEVMSGIRIIKVMAWESSFADKIGTIREQELKHFGRQQYSSLCTIRLHRQHQS